MIGYLITVGNGGTKPTQAAFTIFYNQGTRKYELEQTLQPDEQMWIDVGKLIRESVPDKNGKPLPADLTSGSYEIRDLTNKGVGALFEGKVIYDKTYGHVTYGCGSCCGYKLGRLWYNPLGVDFLGTSDNGLNGLDTCSGQYDDLSGDAYGNWSSSDTTIATVDYYGTHTGQSIGSTYSSTFATQVSLRSLKTVCPVGNLGGSGGVNVTPKILLGGSGGTDITNTTQSVVVGQQIILYGSYTLPSGYTFTSLAWTIPGTGSNPPTAISNFVTTNCSSSSPCGPVSLTTAQLGSSTQSGQQRITYYFVASASSQAVTFTLYYTANGTAQSAAAQATFNIAGPTSVSVSPQRGSVQFLNNGTKSAEIELGDPAFQTTAGIDLNAVVSPPSINGTAVSGTLQWAQIIGNNSYTYTPGSPCSGPAGLDNTFPLQTGNNFNDSPDRPLPSACSEFTWAWSATTYLFWLPGSTIPGNSIPAPLGSVSWAFNADVTQDLPTNTWTLKTSSSSNGTFQASPTYPTWSTVAQNGNMNGCP